MTIDKLSGNFQQISKNNGKSLPSLENNTPSTKSGTFDNVTSINNQVSLKLEERPKNSDFNEQTIKKVKSEIEDIKTYNQQINRSLQFSVDDELGITVVKVVDKATDELIRQFPSDELINLSRKLKDINEEGASVSGVFLQEKV